MKIQRAWNGNTTDHPKSQRRKLSPKLYNLRITAEYAQAEKVTVNGEVCGVRPLSAAHLPFQLIRSRENRYGILDCWLVGDVLHVREKWLKPVLAVLHPYTLQQLDEEPVTITYAQALNQLQAAEARLLASPSPEHETAVQTAKRTLSSLTLRRES